MVDDRVPVKYIIKSLSNAPCNQNKMIKIVPNNIDDNNNNNNSKLYTKILLLLPYPSFTSLKKNIQKA